MRLRSLSLLLVGSVALTGCYHITVESGAPPAPTVVERPWQHSFLGGLVPPAELNVKDQCTNGVSKVETMMSPANVGAQLVQNLLIGVALYTPVSAKVTCASK